MIKICNFINISYYMFAFLLNYVYWCNYLDFFCFDTQCYIHFLSLCPRQFFILLKFLNGWLIARLILFAVASHHHDTYSHFSWLFHRTTWSCTMPIKIGRLTFTSAHGVIKKMTDYRSVHFLSRGMVVRVGSCPKN